MNALLVDDDPIIVTLVTAMLSSKGYDVQSVSSGNELVRLLSGEEIIFDLLLIDLQLGEESGLEIFKAKLESRIALDNVIFMSANSERDAIELYHLTEDMKFLEKPFSSNQLYNLIHL